MRKLEDPNTHASDPVRASRRRLFRVASLLLPLAGVIFLELVLRLFGCGGHPSVIRELAGKSEVRLMVTDPEATRHYFFANRGTTGKNTRFVFPMPKQTNTVRVFLFGGSAIQGFPHPRHLTPNAFLQVMLEDVWPDREIEVINFGTTAVASFPARNLLEQTIWCDPDLVIVYAGHNEFYGAYGIASSNRAGSRPWMQGFHRRIQSLALVQALQSIRFGSKAQPPSHLMQVMVGKDHVGPEDWRREAAALTLSHNIRRMIQRCQSGNIPVMVCTLPSNERDLAPIGTDEVPLPGRGAGRKPNHPQDTASDWVVAASGELESELRNHLDQHPTSPRAHYALGQCLEAQGRHGEAHKQFLQARDLDLMPWRATTRLQDAMRTVVEEEGALLCDVEAMFREHSRGGSIGWELMGDHVHPTLRGQALIAEAIVRNMAALQGTLQVDEKAQERLQSWERYATKLGASDYDRYSVNRWMRVIFNIPFMKASNPLAYDRFNALTTDFEGEQLEEIRSLLQGWDTKQPINVVIAGLLVREGRFEEALPLLRSKGHGASRYSADRLEAVYNELGCLAMINGLLDESNLERVRAEIERGERLVEYGAPQTWIIERTIGRLHLLREEYEEAIPFLLAARPKLNGGDRAVDDRALIRAYVQIGDTAKARNIALDGIALGGPYSQFYLDLFAEIPGTQTAQQTSSPSDPETPSAPAEAPSRKR